MGSKSGFGPGDCHHRICRQILPPFQCLSNFYPSKKLKIFKFWPIGPGVNKGKLKGLDKVFIVFPYYDIDYYHNYSIPHSHESTQSCTDNV